MKPYDKLRLTRMRLSNPVKIVSATFVVSLFFAGCGLLSGSENTAANFALPIRKEVPFATQEPEVFQAEIVVRSGGIERRTLLARDADFRRIDFEPESENHRAVLITDKEYRIDFDRKSYTVREFAASSPSGDELTEHLLNAREYTQFREIGRDGRLITYRALINGNTSSEVEIVFDEAIGLPVRQEFYSMANSERKLLYSYELQNFRTEVDPEMFRLPVGFRREGGK